MSDADRETGNSLYKGKVVVVGGVAVGKTSLVMRLSEGRFTKDTTSSINVAYSTKVIRTPGCAVKLDVWDTAGQERFRSVGSLYYRGAGAGVIVFDLTDERSFASAIDYWLKQLRSMGATGIILVLVGNKADLTDQREVSRERAEAVAAEQNMLYLETSAKDGSNVTEVFEAIVARVPDAVKRWGHVGFKPIAEATTEMREEPEQPPSRHSSCC